jgi:hypothetical protein
MGSQHSESPWTVELVINGIDLKSQTVIRYSNQGRSCGIRRLTGSPDQ